MSQTPSQNVIAFQGEPGAYSHQACRLYRPQMEALPCRTFEDTIEAVRGGRAELAMLPVENSTYGRVADIHHLLPESGLHIVDEGFVRVRISLLAVPGTTLSEVAEAMSHPVLLGQCRGFLRRHGIRSLVGADTAGSALEVARRGEKALAALAAPLAGEIYGLDELAAGIEDRQNNTTRFLVMAPQPDFSRRSNADGESAMITSFVFRVRNIPAALYKALGGFATNGVNMTKLESYMVDGVFTATQFYADIEGHPEDPHVARALEELDYYTSSLNILGVYPADPLRAAQLREQGA
ncbi:prephenate dehydratase [Paracoccus aminovorans]|uniref:prephenate dehydratase n=1 Tax=Paracoccus aminovorans TaxID=34004 RepID=UPI002B25E4CA|nr:prephenate dehydratase [Paracoccus aminovorans]